MAGAAVCAVCDTESGRSAALADQYNIGRVYLDYHNMLEAAELDALCICGCEISAVTEAVQSGKHVLWDIPATLSGEDRRQLQLLADRRRVVLELCAVENSAEAVTAEVQRFLQRLP